MRIAVTYIWTSCLLIECEGIRILTDPWFGNNLRGLPCWKSPGIGLPRIGKIDYVFVSHFHPDHFDKAAIRTLVERKVDLALIGPRGLGRRAGFMPGKTVMEMEGSQRVQYGGFTVEAVAAEHPGKELNYIFCFGDKKIFFGGDTGYSKNFEKIGEKNKKIDLALLPVGGTRVLGKRIVMDPREALKAAREMKAGYLIPIHEGGIWMSVPPLSLHPGRPEHLLMLAGKDSAPPEIVILKNGETFFL